MNVGAHLGTLKRQSESDPPITLEPVGTLERARRRMGAYMMTSVFTALGLAALMSIVVVLIGPAHAVPPPNVHPTPVVTVTVTASPRTTFRPLGSPTIAFQSKVPAANERGWNNTPVTVAWTCLAGNAPLVEQTVRVVVGGQGSALVAQGQCRDMENKVSEVDRQVVSIDKTPPVANFVAQNPSPNAAGWNHSPVVVSWGCTDALSGPVAPTVSRRVAYEGTHQIESPSCTDNAGNASPTLSQPVGLDMTPPSTAINPPSPPILVRGLASLTGVAADGLSGVGVTIVDFDDTAGLQPRTERQLFCRTYCRESSWHALVPPCNGLYAVTARSIDRADVVGPRTPAVTVLVEGVEQGSCIPVGVRTRSTPGEPAVAGPPVAGPRRRLDAIGYFARTTSNAASALAAPIVTASRTIMRR